MSKLLSVAMAMLMVLLPIATANEFTGWVVEGAAPMSTLAIESSLPEYSHTGTITIEGRTKPAAQVHVFVNDARQRVGPADANGNFKFMSISLAEGQNKIKLEPHEGNTVGTAKEMTITYDAKPPVAKLDKEIPTATKENSITVSGSINENVNIKYRSVAKTDTAPPEITGGLRANKIEENAIEIVWDPSTATDLKEYIVERNGKRIATTSTPTYRDINLQPATTYSYSISAVDTSCNIGTSADLAVATKAGKAATPVPMPETNLTCETPYQAATAVTGPFSITIPIVQGFNAIEIIFQDAAGNQDIIKQIVKMDNQGPRFTETNLDKLSPAYIPDITIKGKLDEQATVFVYINNDTKPAEYELSDADGSFSIKTQLRTDRRIKKSSTQTTIEVGEGWANTIKLEAIDLAGNKATFGPYDVDFLLCGLGTYWQANLGEALPSMLLPRLMIQGIQQIGIPFTLQYVGTNTVTAPPVVNVRPIALAAGAEKDYDHNWVQVSSYAGKKSAKNYTGYVQIQFENIDPLPDQPNAGPNEKERALSKHRVGECLTPGVGCVKLFLQMEILFQESIALTPADKNKPIVTPQLVKRTQKVCIPLYVGIDQTIPTDLIPKGLLKAAVKVIGNAINMIDKILKPITTIGEYVMYGCLASNVWLLFSHFSEQLSCTAGAVTGKFSKGVAEIGMCDAVYGSGGQEQDSTKQEACNKCQKSMESRKKFELNVMHSLCDRIGCPSAPTFSTYIKQKVGEAEPLKDLDTTKSPDLAKWAVGSTGGTTGSQGTVYAGNDCAFMYKDFNYITPTYMGGTGTSLFSTEQQKETAKRITEETRVPTAPETTTVPYNRIGIREMYDIAKGNAPKTFTSGPTKDDCKKILHPAHPNCCGVQYQKDWSSACGTGTILGENLDTFDELKQSTCLSAQQANQGASDLNCKSLWNSVAGFCESNTGEPTAQVVSFDAQWQATHAAPTPVRPGADDNAVYVFIVPAGFEASRASLSNPAAGFLGGGGTSTQYSVYVGYAVKTPQFEKMTTAQTGLTDKSKQLKLSAGLTAALETDVSRCFGQWSSVRAEKAKSEEKLTEEQQVQCLYDAVCQGPTTTGYTITPCEKAGNVKKAYDKVNEIVGVPDQQYIVRPYSGLLRSIECICLPAVTSYLQMWRTVLGALHGCFSRILLTGEGSEGFCAAKLSSTICDLLFDAISCITQKFNSPGVGGRAGGAGGFGDILGAMTGAGAAVSKGVTERYGETSMYNSLFSQRQLVHAICTWAFTGTWSLNMQGLFQQQVESIPVDTEGALTTCERTFISYDPTSTPSGLTTWAYRIAGGLIAGADVRYRLKLKCSTGFSCDPRDYRDGKCDCQTSEQTITVSDPALGNGMAKKFALVNFDAPFLVSPQNSYDSAGYRYDTAQLEWDWTDPQTKQVRTDKATCAIRETQGGNAPAFCAWDVFTGKFRCVFGEQENGIRITAANAAYPTNQDAFGLGDPLKFTLDINQKFPEDRRTQNAARKFLTYEIRDAAGNVIDAELKDTTRKLLQITTEPTSLEYTLETNGVYRIAVPKDVDGTPLGNFALNEGTIQRHSATGPASGGVAQRMWGADTLQQFVTEVYAREGTQVSQNRYRFLINFPNYGKNPSTTEAKYEVLLISPGAPDNPAPDQRQGWLNLVDKNAPVLATGQQSADTPTNQVVFSFPGAPQAGAATTVSGSLVFKRVVFNVNAMQILVTYNPPAQAPGAAGCNPKTVLPWKAIFSVFDSDKQGNPSTQLSTDPETGEQQNKTVVFNVRCAQPASFQKATITAGGAAAAPAAVSKQQVADSIKGIVDNSKLILDALKKDLNLNLDNPAARQQVSSHVKELVTKEKTARSTLETLAAGLTPLPTNTANLKSIWTQSIAGFDTASSEIDKTGVAGIVETNLNNVITTLTALISAQQAAINELSATTTPAPTSTPSLTPTTTPAAATDCKSLGGICLEYLGDITCPEGGAIPEANDCSCCKTTSLTCQTLGGTMLPSESCSVNNNRIVPASDTSECCVPP